jgi:hypothetical protein
MVRIDFNRLRFLVIDDNAHMCRILRTLLHGFGALKSMRPRMVQPGLKPLRTTLRGRIEIGFDFRGGEQIFKADADCAAWRIAPVTCGAALAVAG